MNMSSFFLPFCLHELSSATSFCSVMISEEKMYIDFTLSRGHPLKGPLLTHDPQRHKHDRQRMYKRNNQACLRNHWWGGKASITNSVRSRGFSLAYPERHGHTPYCHLWPVMLYHTFPHYLINGTIFGREVTGQKTRVLILLTFVENISGAN
jgi:hypothetical protein